MSHPLVQPSSGPVVYPESDGLPLADNTLQLSGIVTLYGNLAALYRNQPDVFVGGNQFWYPVEGEAEIKNAPDVYVVFGRPKGYRGSYRQWEEGGIPMTVVFEVLSPSNTVPELAAKFSFYEEHGAEEYYVYDPDNDRLLAYVRQGTTLVGVLPVANFISPRLKIRFDTSGPELVIFGPDGGRFLTFEELEDARRAAEQGAQQERQQRLAAEQGTQQEHQQRLAAEQRATQAEQRATQAEQRAARLAELSRKARRQQASPEELAELERLEQDSASP
jgi:Uma2 family endonuclease